MTRSFTEGYKTYNPETEGYGNRQQWRNNFYQRMTPDEASRILNAEDPYDILGVNHHSSLKEIKTAFRRLINKWHPDRNPNNLQEAHEMSQKIIAAYTFLTQ